MSWFIGYTGNHNPVLEEYISSLQLNKIKIFRNNSLNLICGGKVENLSYNLDKPAKGWIVCGVPIYIKEDEAKLIEKEGWDNLLPKEELNVKDIDGHFAGVYWNSDEIIFFNDQLGLREIYFLKLNSNYFFSTRMDWAAKFNRKNEINIDEFSTSWLLTHKITWQNIIKNITQLGPSGKGIIKLNTSEKNSIAITNTPLMINSFNRTEDAVFINHLIKLITIPFKKNRKLSLGLSGGLDSRVLFQLLLTQETSKLQTHTFGDKNNFDAKVAAQIADDYKIKHSLLKTEIPKEDEIVNSFYNYSSQLGISASISDILIYPLYSLINQNYDFIIDGAFGEIFRRAFLVRFSLTGKKEILNRNPEAFLNSLKYSRADIFNNDLNKKMERIALNQIKETLKVFPDPADVGVENWLDNFLIITKVPSVSSLSQTLLDDLCSAYMPFIQPSLLKLGLGLPINNRANLYKRIINDGDKNLNKYSLVKDQIIYPYFLPTFYARIFTKIKRKLGYFYSDENKLKILDKLRDFVLDKISSTEVKNFTWYDNSKTEKLAKDYYNGKKILADQLLWWITFEMWRDNYRIK